MGQGEEFCEIPEDRKTDKMRWFKSILCLTIFLLFIYSGIQLGRPYFRYYSFKTKIEDISRFELEKDKIMNEIMSVANEMKIPVAEQDIILEGVRGRYSVETSWTERVNLFDVYEREYNFHIVVGR